MNMQAMQVKLDSIPPMWLYAGGGVVVVILILVIVLLTRKKKGAVPPPYAHVPYPPQMGQQPPYPQAPYQQQGGPNQGYPPPFGQPQQPMYPPQQQHQQQSPYGDPFGAPPPQQQPMFGSATPPLTTGAFGQPQMGGSQFYQQPPAQPPQQAMYGGQQQSPMYPPPAAGGPPAFQPPPQPQPSFPMPGASPVQEGASSMFSTPAPQAAPPAMAPAPPPTPQAAAPASAVEADTVTGKLAVPAKPAAGAPDFRFAEPVADNPTGWLVGGEGPASGKAFPVDRAQLWVGAASNNALILEDDPTLSGNHFCIVFDKGKLLLYDNKSTNGTFVNGERAGEKPVALKPDDTIKAGRCVLVLRIPVGS